MSNNNLNRIIFSVIMIDLVLEIMESIKIFQMKITYTIIGKVIYFKVAKSNKIKVKHQFSQDINIFHFKIMI